MFQVKIQDANAILPTKAYDTDVGYDLTIISKVKDFSDKISMFDTGLSIVPTCNDYYVEILPRSSFSKTGYILANSVGIIDPTYTGTLKVVLMKVDDSLPNITLPFKGFQLVVRKVERSEMIVVESLEETARGDGGFGSTN